MKTILLSTKKLLHLKLLFAFLFTSAIYAQCIDGPSILSVGQTGAYTASTTTDNYFWSATGGLTINGSNTGASVTVQRTSTTAGKVYLVAYSNTTGTTKQSYCCNKSVSVPAPPQCNLGYYTIEDYLCVTDMHPYWRFSVPNISGATYTWSGQHFNVLSGGNSSYMIGNPTDNGYGFTVYCKIKKTCSNGLTDERTFYYESRSTNSCNQGTTGEVGGSGGGGPISDIEALPKIAELELFSIAPNPIVDKATISVKLQNNNNKLTIKIHDIYGRLVLIPANNKAITNEYSTTIDKSSLPLNSIYFVSFYVNNELRSQKRIITKSK
jgi:hypothetical protein